MNNFNKLLITLIFALHIWGTTTLVSIDNSDDQASDLVHPEIGVISQEFAKELDKDGYDISKLDPIKNDLWDGLDKFNDILDDKNLPIADMDEVNFSGKLKTVSGLFSYNVINENGIKFQVHMAKNIHVYLLRKNLLRKLGYSIPRVKYLKKIKIKFNSEKEKNDFKDIDLVLDLGLSPKRWISQEGSNYLVLHDVAVKMPSEIDGSDIAITMIPDQLTSRALRGSIAAYNLLNMDESINKLSYQAISKQESFYLVDHGTEAVFNSSKSDLEWMIRKISKLSRADFEEIVTHAYLPDVVSKLLVERLIARRNSMINLFSINSQELAYTKDLKLDGVKDGFLNTQNFEGYASQFSYGVQKGPLDDFWRYILVEVQSAAMGNMTDKINSYLKGFDVGQAKYEWLIEDFNKNRDHAIEYFTEHGEFPELPVSTWKSKVANANLILGRNIVIGGSLGTDNFVQLADTAGLAMNLGLHYGVERLFSPDLSSSIFPNVGGVLSYTHVKPVTSMKEALKEPYKNILVTWLTSKFFSEIEEIKSSENLSGAKRDEKIKSIFSKISEQIGTGESLIISESITPDVSATMRLPVLETGSISLTGGMKYKHLKRIQIYRKSKFDFHVYFDDGGIVDLYSRGSFNYYIPAFLGESKSINGKMNINHFIFNLNPNIKENPDFYRNAAKFIALVKDRDKEVLAESDLKIQTQFDDKSTSFSIFFFMNKWVKKLTNLLVKVKNFDDTKYVASTYGKQSGVNYLDFLKQVANYYLKKEIGTVSLEVDTFKNPGRAIYGSSYTTDVQFEAKLKDISKEGDLDNFDVMYAQYEVRREGGTISEKSLWKKLDQVNNHFRREIFSKEHSRDAGGLSLYKIETKMHLYHKAIQKIISLNQKDITKLENKAKENISSYCEHKKRNGQVPSTIAGKLRCGDYSYLLRLKNLCVENFYDDDVTDGQKCMSRVIYFFAHYVELDSLINLVGPDNIYIESNVNGFRKNHEYIYRPVNGNSFGRRNSKFRNGPFEEIRNFLGILGGELDGSWFRERL